MENPPEMISISYVNKKNNILNKFATISITTCVILFAIYGITVDSIEMNWIVITSIIFISILVLCGIYNMLKSIIPSFTSMFPSFTSMFASFTSMFASFTSMFPSFISMPSIL